LVGAPSPDGCCATSIAGGCLGIGVFHSQSALGANMTLHFLFRVLEMAFFIGMLGSLAVAILTSLADIPELFRRR
jgi:hypothetical protein